MGVLPNLFKLWPWVDLNPFYSKVKFGHIGFCMGKSENYLFLAHLSHRLRVSYCHWPMSVVRRASSVVRRQQNCFKQHLLWNRYAYGLNIWYVALPNGPLPSLFEWWPWGLKWPCGGGSWVQKWNILQNLLLQNCLAQVLEIWYLALPGGPLPSLFKPRFQDPRWPRQKSSSSEPHGPDVWNLVCSIA